MAKITFDNGETLTIKGVTAAQFNSASDQEKQAMIERAAKGFDGYDKLSTGLRTAIGQGALFGWGDEAEAGIRSLFEDRSYEDIRDELRGDLREFRDEHPVISPVLEVAGGFLTPMGVVGGTAKAANAGYKTAKAMQAATKAGGFLPNTGKAILAGMAGGAVAGAGASEEESATDIAKDAGQGAVFGGATAGVLSGGAQVGKGVISHFAKGLGAKSDDVALSKMFQALRDEGLSPAQAAKKLREVRAQGIDNPMIADLGEKARATGRAGMDMSPSRTDALDRLTERFSGQAENIADEVGSRLSTGGRATDFFEEIADAQKAAARKAYPEAYSVDVSVQPFRELVDDPTFRKFYEQAREASNLRLAGKRMEAQAMGKPLPDDVPLPDVDALRNSQYVPTEIMHKIKQELYKVAEGTKGGNLGKRTDAGEAIFQMQKGINDYLKKVNSAYRKAQEEFADYARVKTAYETGANLHKMSEKEMAKVLRGFTPAEKEALRHGIFERITQRAGDASDSVDFAKEVFGSPKKRSMLRYAFDDEAAYKRFNDFIDLQKGQVRTKNELTGGSPTSRRQAENADAGVIADVLLDATTGGGLSATQLAGRYIKNSRVGGLAPEAAGRIADGMTATDRKTQVELLRELSKLPFIADRASRKAAVSPTLYGLGLGGGAGLLTADER